MSSLDLILRRRAIVKQIGGGILPSGYTQYDWVECNNSQGEATSYIDVGYAVERLTSQPTFVFEGSVARTGNVPSDYRLSAIFSSRVTAGDECCYGLMREANTSDICFCYNSRAKPNKASEIGRTQKSFTKGTWHTFSIHSAAEKIYGGAATIDGEDYSMGSLTAPNLSTNNIKLFCGYPCRIARFKISKDGAVVADLVPAMRDSDSVVGYYDIVRETFYPPTGTAEFTAGYGMEDFTV